MSARDMWRWLIFSLTGRVPGRAQGGQVAEQHDTPPTVMAPGKEITDPDEAEALGLTASARRMRERRVVGAEEAAGLLGEPDFVDAFTNPELIGDEKKPNWHKEERRLIAECGDTDDCCTVDACRLDAHRLLPHSGTVKVPEDVLRDLVRAVRYVADSEPYPDPVAAHRALGALDDAGLLDQLKEEDQ